MNAHAVALGRRGGKAGVGKAKARTSEQARKAAMARWQNKRQSKMKTTKTILREAQAMSDEYEYYADAERVGEISRSTYFRACAKAGLSREEASECLRENYQRAGLGHLFAGQ